MLVPMEERRVRDRDRDGDGDGGGDRVMLYCVGVRIRMSGLVAVM